MSKKQPQIETRILRGFRDFLPSQMIPRQKMLAVIRDVFERFGFVPLETPTLEYEETLTGKYGEEGDMLLYRFEDQGGRKVAMRYDLTVPLSRVVAMYPELPKLFKRYQIQPVWRAEKPQKGRFREFFQCDVDIVGTSSMAADAECVDVARTVITELGVEKFLVKINNRKILNGFITFSGIADDQVKRVFQAIDKLPKVGPEGVAEELLQEKEIPYEDPLSGLSQDKVDKILEFAKLTGSNQEILDQLKDIFKSVEIGLEGVNELQQVINNLEAIGITDKECQIDLSIARGLDYYTGTVFETFIQDLPGFGSVMSGGRFDELIGMFLGKNIPAVGISLGLDRLFAAMEELGMIEASPSTSEVLVTVFDPNLFDECLKVANELRKAGINTELYVGEETKIGKQMKYADKQGIPFVIIIGGNEVEKGVVMFKDLAAASQTEVKREVLAEHAKKSIASKV